MLTNHNDIKAWLDSMDIDNYTIHDTNTVTVDGNVDIWDRNLTEIPVQFRIVYGGFYCSRNIFTTMPNCDTIINGQLIWK